MTESLRRDLGDGLLMRTLQCEADVVRLATAHRESFGEAELEPLTLDILHHRPHTSWDDFIVVEDTSSGDLVSSICLLPETWAYEDVILKVAEVGIVGTRQGYLRRGLVRAQMQVFEEWLQEHGYDLGAIEGIPYFYRQFGYEYAIPLNNDCRLLLEQVPTLGEDAGEAATIRPMTDEDIPAAMRFYAASTAHLCIRAWRDEAQWAYQLHLSAENPGRQQGYMIAVGGRDVGYMMGGLDDWDPEGWVCREMSDVGYDAILSALRRMRKEAEVAGRKRINLRLHASAPIMRVAKGLGGTDKTPYAWQIRIPNRVRFIRRIAPVLERRLADSVFAGVTQTLQLNFYEETIELVLDKGRVTKVTSIGRTDARDIRLPPLPAVQLLTCYRSRAEISDYRLDLGVSGKFQLIMDTLFPKRESYIYRVL